MADQRAARVFLVLFGGLTGAAAIGVVPHEVYGVPVPYAVSLGVIGSIAAGIATARWHSTADPGVGVFFPLLGIHVGLRLALETAKSEPYVMAPALLLYPAIGLIAGRVFARGWRVTDEAPGTAAEPPGEDVNDQEQV